MYRGICNRWCVVGALMDQGSIAEQRDHALVLFKSALVFLIKLVPLASLSVSCMCHCQHHRPALMAMLHLLAGSPLSH
jgi:hypothetical protein